MNPESYTYIHIHIHIHIDIHIHTYTDHPLSPHLLFYLPVSCLVLSYMYIYYVYYVYLSQGWLQCFTTLSDLYSLEQLTGEGGTTQVSYMTYDIIASFNALFIP
jgi:hypothetical protein